MAFVVPKIATLKISSLVIATTTSVPDNTSCSTAAPLPTPATPASVATASTKVTAKSLMKSLVTLSFATPAQAQLSSTVLLQTPFSKRQTAPIAKTALKLLAIK